MLQVGQLQRVAQGMPLACLAQNAVTTRLTRAREALRRAYQED